MKQVPHNSFPKLPRNALSCSLGLMLLLQTLPIAFAQSLSMAQDNGFPVAVKGEISIDRDVKMASNDVKISLNVRDASLRDVLNIIAKQGNFNIILDESVEGTLTVDVNNISINKALEYIFTVSNLSYTKDGNTMIVADKKAADSKSLNAQTFKAIPVLYKNASTVATQLNKTLFSISRPGGSDKAIASSDPDSNSLLIMGTDSDIKLVGDALRELDVPRNRKVYHIKHNTPQFVAQVLAANFFGSSANAASGGGAGANANAAGGAGGNNASTGGGAGGSTTGSGGASGSGSGGGSASGGSTGTGPTVINAGGVTFIAEPVSSTLTVLGTDEQINLIDTAMNDVDVRRPQVSIEVSLVEVQNSDIKSVVPSFNSPVKVGSYTLNLLSSNLTNTLAFAGGPILPGKFKFQKQASGADPFTIDQQFQQLKGRVLANPNIVALDGTSSNIQITDELPSVSQQISQTSTSTQVTTNITKQSVGISLAITPRVSNDGSVTLNIQPAVTQPIREVKAGTVATGIVSTFLVSTRSLSVESVRVIDGQTLIIGGLLRESDSSDLRKVPGLSDLPILGAMFRATTASRKDRTELVLMVTPHILKENAVTYFSQPGGIQQGNQPYNNPNQGGIQPVSLPKFTGKAQQSLSQPDEALLPAEEIIPLGPQDRSSKRREAKMGGIPEGKQDVPSPLSFKEDTVFLQEEPTPTNPKVKLQNKPETLDTLDEVLK